MGSRFLWPTEVINQKEMHRTYNKNLYDLAAEVINRFCEINKTYGDVIIKIKVRSDYMGEHYYESTEFVNFNGDDFRWDFNNDFDEGDEYITITNICYLFEVFE